MRAEKLFYRRFASIDPFLMTATVAACFVATGALEDTVRIGLDLAGFVLITLAVVGTAS